MPRYTNVDCKAHGNEFLKVPADTTNQPSVYFYDIPDLSFNDATPYYNPVLYKQVFNFNGGETFNIDLPPNAIGQNSFIYIQTRTNTQIMTDVEIYFNSLTNVPCLPLCNSTFNMNNCHRIKRIYAVISMGCQGELLVMATDKFVPTLSTIDLDGKP